MTIEEIINKRSALREKMNDCKAYRLALMNIAKDEYSIAKNRAREVYGSTIKNIETDYNKDIAELRTQWERLEAEYRKATHPDEQ